MDCYQVIILVLVPFNNNYTNKQAKLGLKYSKINLAVPIHWAKFGQQVHGENSAEIWPVYWLTTLPLPHQPNVIVATWQKVVGRLGRRWTFIHF